MKKIAVFGSGTMGNGIAHVFALNGFSVQIFDQNEEILSKALKTITANLDRQIKKNVITDEQKNSTLMNIKFETNYNKIDCETDLIVEAIFENKAAKVNLYNEILSKIKSDCILASNTSSISITELAPKSISDRFIGMHFMNPVPMMELVEIINGHKTSVETLNKIVELTKKINKKPVVVQDYPGFIANRILMPMINEAVFALYEGVASAEDIDQVMKLGMNHPMGPLALADFIGLDVCLNILEVLYNGFNDSKYRPCPLLKKMVASGNLGRKSGIGFYKYST